MTVGTSPAVTSTLSAAAIFAFSIATAVVGATHKDHGEWTPFVLSVFSLCVWGWVERYITAPDFGMMDVIGTPEDDLPHLPYYKVFFASVTDTSRMLLAEFVAVFGHLVAAICTAIAPANAKYYLYHGVQPKGALMGAAVMFSPPDGPKPDFFQCNVGYMDDPNKHDLVATDCESAAIIKSWASDPEKSSADGLSGGVVAEFPIFEKHHWAKYLPFFFAKKFKQFNLSAWRSQDDAVAWAKGSKAHNRIVLMQRSRKEQGGLHSFSGLLATMKPAQPFVYGNRCRNCTWVAYDWPTTTVCRECHTPLPHQPNF